MTKLQTNIYHGGTEAVNKPSMTNFHKFSGDPKCIPTSQRSFIGHLNDKFFVAKPSYSFDSGFIHSFTEARRKPNRYAVIGSTRVNLDLKTRIWTGRTRREREFTEKDLENPTWRN